MSDIWDNLVQQAADVIEPLLPYSDIPSRGDADQIAWALLDAGMLTEGRPK